MPRAKDSQAALVALAKWTTDARQYEKGFDDKLAENSKMNVIEQIMPQEDYDRAIRGGIYTTFEEMYERAKMYLKDKPGYRGHAKKSGTKPKDDEDRMDVDELAKTKEHRLVVEWERRRRKGKR